MTFTKYPLIFLLVTLSSIFLYLQFRGIGLYPFLFGDEWTYSLLSRLSPAEDAIVPSYLYLALFKATNYCGEGFLECARFLNIFFYMSSAPFIYLIVARAVKPWLAVTVTLVSLLSGANIYTLFFMPESMYFFAFWVFSWFVLNADENKFYYGIIAGAILGTTSLVKFHGLFLIPCFFIYHFTVIVISNSNKKFRDILLTSILFLSTTISVRLLGGYLIAGEAGLGLFGSAYGSMADTLSESSNYFQLGHMAAISLAGHVMSLVILFSIPILMSLTIPWDKNKVAINNSKVKIHIYLVAVFMVLLPIVSAFTAKISGTGIYETVERLHMRYYNFAFPLFYIFLASQLSSTRIISSIKGSVSKVILILALLITAFFFLLSNFSPTFVDSPTMSAITRDYMTFNLFLFLSFILIVVWGYNEKLATKLYLLAFSPILLFNTLSFINTSVHSNQVASVWDNAGKFVHQYLPSTDLSELVVVGDNYAGLQRTLFHIDSADTSILHLGTGQEILPSAVSPETEWILVLGDHEFIGPTTLKHSLNGFTLLKLGNENLRSLDFREPFWPGIVDNISGTTSPEFWGRWSNSDEVEIKFSSPLPENFKLTLTSTAYTPYIDQPFQISIGAIDKIFQLDATIASRSFIFSLESAENVIIIRAPEPITSGDLSNEDERGIAIGLVTLRIEKCSENSDICGI